MTLIVCPLRFVSTVVAERRPSHLITLLGAEDMIETPDSLPPERHLRLAMHDIAAPIEGMTHPTAEMVDQILAFGRAWPADAPLLIHCHAGISRSTAAAFAIACDRNPDMDEMAIGAAMRRASPAAYPNRRITALADDILGRRGRMLDAVEAMGTNHFVAEGSPFDLAL